MFSSRDPQPKSGVFESVLGKGLELKGNITSKGSIRVDGSIEGSITSQGEIMVGQEANVRADLKATTITIAGTVTGNIVCSGRLELLPTAHLNGDLSAGSLVISEGAIFTGSAQMSEPPQKQNASTGDQSKTPKGKQST